MSGEVFVPPILLNENLRAKCCVLGDFQDLGTGFFLVCP